MARPTFGTIDGDGTLRRAGRPTLPADERLSAGQFVRYRPSNFDRVCRAASALGVDPTAFTRQASIEAAEKILDGKTGS